MSLEYAILGFLSYHPYTGYDLKKVFDSSVRQFWPADQSQIYKTLSQLMKKGWVEMEKIQQEDRPDRKVYSITATGKQSLLAWLAGPSPTGETRSASLIQVFFSGKLSDKEVLAKFEWYAELIRSVLAQYDQIPAQWDEYARELASPREMFFWNLTLDLGQRSMRANLEWAESVIERIKKGEAPAL